MKFLNKVFNGDQSDKTPLSDPPPADLPVHKEDLNLTPLDQLATGEPAEIAVPFANAMTVEEEVKLPDLAQELAYLDKYESLQNKMNVSELYDIFNTLESISHSLTDANQSKAKPDDVLETWKPFTVKKKLLQSIEAQMNQTIVELREIHQKMFDSISQVRAYNSEREAMYAVRRQLADDLEKKLRLIQNLG
ncbi:MAG: hypothetical protein NT095_12390 [Burkholderiales bacterium]|nr:hypothetical protein [Burkholderiales bacterium]